MKRSGGKHEASGTNPAKKARGDKKKFKGPGKLSKMMMSMASSSSSTTTTQEHTTKSTPPSVKINIPAFDEPAQCQCWDHPEKVGPWTTGRSWSYDMFKDLEGKALGADLKATMCGDPDIPYNAHRKLHISLANGTMCIDLPILEDVDGVTYYVQHDYCTMHQRFEKKSYFLQRPGTPIYWGCCSRTIHQI